MNKQYPFSIIKSPFYVNSINDLHLDGEMESSFGDFQDILKLTDEQADARDNETTLTNFECLQIGKSRKVFTIAQNAVITGEENGVFSTTDIFGEQLTFTITKAQDVLTLKDVLEFQENPENIIPAHDLVLIWIEEHKKAINQLVDIKYHITDEYRHDNSLLYRGDLQIDFQINKQKFDIVYPYFISISEKDDALVLSGDLVDISRDDNECFQSILDDALELPQAEIDDIASKIDQAFFNFFDLTEVPFWQEKILNSFEHGGILDILKNMKLTKQLA